MIYLHETFEFKPELAEDYLSHIVNEMKKLVVSDGKRSLGLFRTAFRNIEGVMIWEHDDWPPRPSWSTMDHQPEMASYLARRLPYRNDWFDRLLVPTDFCPTAEEVLSRGYQNKLYLEVTAEVLSDQLGDLLALIGGEGVAISKSRGMELVGCYETAAGNGIGNEVIVLWAIDDWAHWGAVRDARKSDTAVASYVNRSKKMLRRWSYKFLRPLPASPLQ